MISHEARRWLRVVLVEPHEEDVLLLCNWIAAYRYEPMDPYRGGPQNQMVRVGS